jgi:hypothetical protein
MDVTEVVLHLIVFATKRPAWSLEIRWLLMRLRAACFLTVRTQPVVLAVLVASISSEPLASMAQMLALVWGEPVGLA